MKILYTIALLVLSNIFMAFAWYGHLKKGSYGDRGLFAVILISWGIAFFSILCAGARQQDRLMA